MDIALTWSLVGLALMTGTVFGIFLGVYLADRYPSRWFQRFEDALHAEEELNGRFIARRGATDVPPPSPPSSSRRDRDDGLSMLD